jgi:protein-histidine pros-kinase
MAEPKIEKKPDRVDATLVAVATKRTSTTGDTNMGKLKLLLFFNLVFIPVLVLSFFGAAYIVRGQLQENAEQQILENSRVMMQTARASRLYTTKQIAPLLDHEQSRVDKANNNLFQILDMQLPTALQKAIEVTGHRETPDGDSLYLCAPIRVDDASCLTCHSTAETAPLEIVKIYGTANGFGWKLNDVVGAQIVSIPAKLTDVSAENAFRIILLWLGGISLVFVATNILVLLFAGPVLANMAVQPGSTVRECRESVGC